MKYLYLIYLTLPDAKVGRYAIYEKSDSDTGLSPLWGAHLHIPVKGPPELEDIKKACQYPYMIYFPQPPVDRNDRYPAFHFYLKQGYRKCREDVLASALAIHFGEDISLIPLDGWMSPGYNASPALAQQLEPIDA